jgi:hypothetical protein
LSWSDALKIKNFQMTYDQWKSKLEDTLAQTTTIATEKSSNVTFTVSTDSSTTPPTCVPSWECSGWSECDSFGTQTRTCTDQNSCGVTASKPAESQSCTQQIVEPQPITLSGAGKEVTSRFRLEKGLSVFNMKHEGSSNFILWLMDTFGQNKELLANEIGSFQGSTALGITSAGDYVMDITADGSWNIRVEQPRPTTGPPLPLTLTGTGHKATNVFYLNSSLVRFGMKHDGQSNYIIWLMDKNGGHVELLANEIGAFSGSKGVGITKPGLYLLDVTADGNWQVSMDYI